MKKNKKCRIRKTGLAAALACAVLLGKGPAWNVQAERAVFVSEVDCRETEFSDENGCEVGFEEYFLEDFVQNNPEEEDLGEDLSVQELPDNVETEESGEGNAEAEDAEEYSGGLEGEGSEDSVQEDSEGEDSGDFGLENNGEVSEQEDPEGEDPEAPDQEDAGEKEPENPEQENSEEGETETPKPDDIEEEVQEADFVLRAEAQKETAKAGERLLYSVTAENTGDLPLENLSFKSSFGEKELSGVWENLEGEPLTDENSGILEAGQSRSFYLSVSLSEDRTEPVTLDLTANAWYYPEMVSDDELDSQTEPVALSRELTVTTPVTALKADFKVTKTADRTMAVPGDRVLFQICIQNTGERTLHSVLTTEKFQMEGVPVEFLEKEGVTLNKTKTKALISKLEPDSSFSLQAVVQLPENIKEQELINEVEVVTAETGSSTLTSSAAVQIRASKPTESPMELSAEAPSDPAPQTRRISDNPKTGDASALELWISILVIAFLIAVFFYIRYFRGDISDHIKKRNPPSEEQQVKRP